MKRRSFLKGLAALALAPLLPRTQKPEPPMIYQDRLFVKGDPAPAFTFTNDTDTRMFRYGDVPIRLVAGGKEIEAEK